MVQTEARVTATQGALAGVRVLDFTWVRAGPWATRWLGALGAEIIKVEWPENPDTLRRLGGGTTPPGIEVNLNTSGQFNDTNANKRSITLNTRTPRGMELIRRLVSISDVVIENFSSRVMENWGLGYEELCKLRPDIIYVSMAGFGHTGRQHHYTTMGPSAQALSGMTYLSGLPDHPPAGWGWSYLDDTGGMYGAMSVLTALHHHNATGQGQYVDLSQMTVGITLNGPALLDHLLNNRPSRREGYPPGNRAHWPNTPLVNNYRGRTVAPHNSYRTSPADYNDWCVIACFSDDEWRRLVEVMGSPEWAIDEKFATLKGRLEHQEELDEHMEEWTITLDKYELMERCQAAGVRAMPVQTSEDRVEHDPQLRHRGMYKEMEHPALGVRKLQNAPFKLSETPAVNSRPGPLIGQHNREVFEGILGLRHEELVDGYQDGTFWPTTMDRFPYIEEILKETPGRDGEAPLFSHNGGAMPSPGGDGGRRMSTNTHGPLAGLRVLELADEKGQWCGKLMADLGAEVIKIEPSGGEATRTVGPFYRDVPNRERSLSFWHYNTSKRGITLSLETEDGRRLFRRLAATADIILETFRPGYMASLGLGYEELKKDNPGLIMCSLTDFGQTGPWKDYLTSDLLHLAAGGQMGCCGYDEEEVPIAPPIAPGGGQAWHMGSHYAYIAILAAVCYRDVTGSGQYIDTSVHDACALTTEGHVPTYIYTGRVSTGLRRQAGAQHLIPIFPKIHFRSKDGKYVNALIGFGFTAQRVRVVAEWLDSHGMAEDLLDEKYQDPAKLQENLPHISEVVANFITHSTQDEVYHGGQERGFPWGAIRAPDELVDDGHLQDRRFWVEVEHPELGRSVKYPGGAAIWNGSPWHISRRAPLVGEHNEEVLCGELGLSRLELAVLAEGGVV
jgi:crotonobetainyl-CoA:carnitine CoA-transferase CaiB-like acyl-CoA transferase